MAVIVILALCHGCNVNPENPALYQNIVDPLNDVPPPIPLRLCDTYCNDAGSTSCIVTLFATLFPLFQNVIVNDIWPQDATLGWFATLSTQRSGCPTTTIWFGQYATCVLLLLTAHCVVYVPGAFGVHVAVVVFVGPGSHPLKLATRLFP